MHKRRIGILALQGCIEQHLERLREIDAGLELIKVRESKDLLGLDGIILPGGESSTMLKLLKLRKGRFFRDLQAAIAGGLAAWGICAGSILLARQVFAPKQDSLGAIELLAVRNYYGSQLDSFKGEVRLFDGTDIPADFIRAPLLLGNDPEHRGVPLSTKSSEGNWNIDLDEVSSAISELGKTTVIAICDEQPVGYLSASGRVLATAFHTELTPNSVMHRFFLNQVVGS